MTKEQLNKIDEEFASIIHDVWSKWQEYLHSKCEIQENKVSFPKLLFERWERQISTSYNLLPENEKQSDRNVFEEYYKDFIHSKLQEAYELGKRDERERIINTIEKIDIIQVHTHSSENAEIYHAHTNGELAMKNKIINELK